MALHVRTHERTVRIVVFKEGNERRRNRNKLFGRNVHIVDAFAGKLGNKLSVTAADAFAHKMSFAVEGLVCLRNDVSVLFVRRKIVDVIGNDSRLFIHLAVRGHNEAEFVHT